MAVGKLKEDYLKRAAAEYATRLSRHSRVEIAEVPEEDIASRPAKAVKAIEADRLLAKLPEGRHVIALDREGKELSSEAFADYLEKRMTGGESRFVFVLGGPLGLDRQVLDKADLRLSLSKLTFPHQMARVILLEQLYRAFKIIKNEPYHY